jgi:hypothetical protein
MEKDRRLSQVLELIAQVFGDESLPRKKAIDILKDIQEDVEIRLDSLASDEKSLDDFIEDEDRSC